MYLKIKFFFDVLVAIFGIFILLPFLLPIMICLKLSGNGNIFYLQKRLGYKNKSFFIYKFATMQEDNKKRSGLLTEKNDSRITPIGKFLRKSKINELPQLLNILTGEMSIVGPRPLPMINFKAYSLHVQQHIYDVVPGITGIGSLVFRNEEKYFDKSLNEDPMDFYKREIAPYKGEVELWYKENQCFRIDLKIILLTAYVVFNPEDDQIVYTVFKNLPRFEPQLIGIDI